MTWSQASKLSSRGLSRGASEPAFGWAPRHTLHVIVIIIVIVILIVKGSQWAGLRLGPDAYPSQDVGGGDCDDVDDDDDDFNDDDDGDDDNDVDIDVDHDDDDPPVEGFEGAANQYKIPGENFTLCMDGARNLKKKIFSSSLLAHFHHEGPNFLWHQSNFSIIPYALPQGARTHEESQGRIEPTDNHDEIFSRYCVKCFIML